MNTELIMKFLTGEEKKIVDGNYNFLSNYRQRVNQRKRTVEEIEKDRNEFFKNSLSYFLEKP